jgi:hypothetical protein
LLYPATPDSPYKGVLSPDACRAAAVGLMSGGWGAVVYSLHCPEMGAPFIGTWYLLGILIPTVLGALLGETLLRW